MFVQVHVGMLALPGHLPGTDSVLFSPNASKLIADAEHNLVEACKYYKLALLHNDMSEEKGRVFVRCVAPVSDYSGSQMLTWPRP